MPAWGNAPGTGARRSMTERQRRDSSVRRHEPRAYADCVGQSHTDRSSKSIHGMIVAAGGRKDRKVHTQFFCVPCVPLRLTSLPQQAYLPTTNVVWTKPGETTKETTRESSKREESSRPPPRLFGCLWRLTSPRCPLDEITLFRQLLFARGARDCRISRKGSSWP